MVKTPLPFFLALMLDTVLSSSLGSGSVCSVVFVTAGGFQELLAQGGAGLPATKTHIISP